MKDLFLGLSLLVFVNISYSQAPNSFSYQGIALDTKGVPVASKQISLRISILQGSSSGAVVLKETFTPTTDKYGQFSVAIGQGTVISGSMSSIQWGNSSHYLKAEIDIDGGSNYVNVGTSQLLSVPYAIHASNSSKIDTLELADSLGNIKAGQNAFQNNKTGMSNVALGKNSLNLLDSGSYNVAIGENALSKFKKVRITEFPNYFQIGSYSVAVGYNSSKNSLGDRNTSVGSFSLENNQNGWWNTAIGYEAMKSNTSGERNVALGYGSMVSNNTGRYNVAIGSESMLQNRTGSSNVTIGLKSLLENRFGNGNSVIGFNAVEKMQIGDGNVVLGHQGGWHMDSSSYNVLIGYNVANDTFYSKLNNRLIIANSSTKSPLIYGEFDNKKLTINGDLNVTGKFDYALNPDSVFNTFRVDTKNTRFQNTSLKFIKGVGKGQNNIAIGDSSLYLIDSGWNNIAIGDKALINATGGHNNIGIGSSTLSKISKNANQNNSVGVDALKLNETGCCNNAFGSFTLSNNTTGHRNSAFGNFALNQNTTGIMNSGFGRLALWKNKTGSWNTAIGVSALSADSSGSGNTAIGFQAGSQLIEGSRNIFIGINSGVDSSFRTINDKLIIANNATNKPLIYGEFDNKKLTINGDLNVTGNVTSDTLFNTKIGTNSMNNNTLSTGSNNTAIGYESLYSSNNVNSNTAIGYYAGRNNVSGADNTYLGSFTTQSGSNLNNITVVGKGASASSSNTITLGNSDVTKWVFGIPTTTDPGYAFQVGSTTSNGNGAFLTNGGTWTNASSRDFKENFEDIDGADLLNRVEKIKVQKWSYKGTDEVHVGPVAEEFKSLFNLGIKNDNKHISTIDASGIALRSVQELKKKLDEKDKQINELKLRLHEVEKLINKILESK